MLNVFTLGLALVDGVIAVPAAIVSLEIAAALPPLKKRAMQWTASRPAMAVLVPAHNERDTIAATVRLLRGQLDRGDRLLVVADNCSDDTAMLARQAGAEVVERHDLVRRGKGFALDYGVRHLAADPRPVVVIVDADVTPTPGSLDALARQAAETGRPVQGVYLLRQSPTAPASPISMLAFQVRNFVRPLGLSRLGGPCPLFGAGMGFPWEIISRSPLASAHLTEDVALALDLACVGQAPMLCRDALIESESAPTDAASAKQRRRWEHGHLSLILSAAPRTFLRGLKARSPAALVLALDVMVPPLSLLMMLVTAATVVTAAAAALGGVSGGLAVAQACVMVTLVGAIMTASLRFSEPGHRGRQLWLMTRYAAGKVPIYAGFFLKRQTTWERTDRAPRPNTPSKPSRPSRAA